MPEMGGRELAERLIEQRDSVAVLFMSGYTDDAIVHHRIRGLGSGFLQKPFTPELLARTVRQALDRKDGVTVE